MAIGGSPSGAPRAKDGSKGSAGRFTFVAEVARGYLGTLWLARDGADASESGTVCTRHVTPLVAASARAAILEGARWAIAGSDSPIFQVFEGRTAVDLVTPFIDAEVLRSLLRTAAVKHATVESTLLLGLARELIEQLESVHERATATKSPHGFGSVHPDSVLVDLTGRVHLLDVGAGAAASAREPWRSDPQRVGYFAPEQTEARGTVDARTDVFAIGILLWEALANRRLFPGNDAKTTRERVQKGPIGRLDATRSTASPGIATEIADVVARCLERAPAARFQSLEELRQAIEGLDAASPERVGAWVTSLADVAIAKRRQFLERALTQPASVFPRRDSITAQPPSVRPRPSSSPLSDHPITPPVADTRAAAPSSLPPPPAHVTPPAPPAHVTPPAPPAHVTPPARSTAVAATTSHSAPTATPRPPPPSSFHSPTPAPRPAATSAADPPHAAVPVPPTRTPPTPPSSAAAATPLPPSRRPVPPPRPHDPAPPPAPSAPVASAEPVAAHPAPPPAPSAPVASAEPVAAPPRPPADSAEAIEPSDESEDGPEEDDEIESDPEGDSVPQPPQPHSKQPPPLPHETHPHAVDAAHDAEHPAPPAEPLAKPIHTTELASLTAPTAPSNNLGKRAAVAAVILAVAAGGLLMGRSKPRPAETPPSSPTAQRTVQTPPVHIDEHLSAVVPADSAAPPNAAPAASATPAASAAAAVSAEAAHPAPTAAHDETPPSAEASAAKPASGEKPPSPKPRPASGVATDTPHRPSSSHGTPSSGFKPGGI